MRRRRWRPGKGWTRVADAGNWVTWMRPHPDGGVEITVFTGDAFGHGYRDDDFYTPVYGEVWRVWAQPGSHMPYTVMDKMHRIRWVMDYGDPYTHLVERFRVPPYRRSWHRRGNYRRQVHSWPVPRTIERAIGGA